MKSPKDIEQLIVNTRIKPRPNMHNRVLESALKAQTEFPVDMSDYSFLHIFYNLDTFHEPSWERLMETLLLIRQQRVPSALKECHLVAHGQNS